MADPGSDWSTRLTPAQLAMAPLPPTLTGPVTQGASEAAAAATPETAAARRLWRIVLPFVLPLALFVGRAAGEPSSAWGASSPITMMVSGAERPTPEAATSARPLGLPQGAPAAPGAYAFLNAEADGRPVTYDPCRPIRIVVNDRAAPPGAAKLVTEAVRTIRDVTGLRFVYEGATDESPSTSRAAFQRDRYGDRWAPVLLAWSDEAEVPELAGNVAGIGGSTRLVTGRGPSAYVSGLVVLDGPQIGALIDASYTGQLQARGVVLHELGHLVGLAHVEDPAQLMHGSSSTVDPQSGDLAGLVQLGRGACLDYL